jgi:large subunit ribosomal protein L6
MLMKSTKEKKTEMDSFSVAIPEGAKISVNERRIVVEGPKGKIEKDFDDPRFNDFVSFEKKDNEFVIHFDGSKRKIKAMAGTIRAHAKNMFVGVTKGYTYSMRIVYTHFPITVVSEKGKLHVKNFLGEKGARTANIVGDVQLHIDKESVTVTGTNLEAVSQTAANLERSCKLKKRDRRIFQDGIYITGKAI